MFEDILDSPSPVKSKSKKNVRKKNNKTFSPLSSPAGDNLLSPDLGESLDGGFSNFNPLGIAAGANLDDSIIGGLLGGPSKTFKAKTSVPDKSETLAPLKPSLTTSQHKRIIKSNSFDGESSMDKVPSAKQVESSKLTSFSSKLPAMDDSIDDYDDIASNMWNSNTNKEVNNKPKLLSQDISSSTAPNTQKSMNTKPQMSSWNDDNNLDIDIDDLLPSPPMTRGLSSTTSATSKHSVVQFSTAVDYSDGSKKDMSKDPDMPVPISSLPASSSTAQYTPSSFSTSTSSAPNPPPVIPTTTKATSSFSFFDNNTNRNPSGGLDTEKDFPPQTTLGRSVTEYSSARGGIKPFTPTPRTNSSATADIGDTVDIGFVPSFLDSSAREPRTKRLVYYIYFLIA